MKTLKEFLLTEGMVSTDGMHYDIDHAIKDDKPEYNTIDEMPIDDWMSQGVKYVLAYPPHTSNGTKVDYFMVVMFIKGKKVADMYAHTEKYAVIDLKTRQVVNKDTLNMEHAGFKVLRLE